MKRTAILLLCFVILTTLVGCRQSHTTTTNNKQSVNGIIIDTALFDIDKDGVVEDCFMTFGPTSGLFTIVVTAFVDGDIKYKNTFNLRHGDYAFGEKDGVIQIVKDGKYHKIYVVEKRIVIDDLDSEYEGYWGDSEWNYSLK